MPGMSDASSASPSRAVDLVDDGMTESEIAAHTDAWRDRLNELPVVDLRETAAEALAAVREASTR